MTGKKAKELRSEMKRIVGNLDSRWLQAAGKELGENLSKLLSEDIPHEIEHILAWVSFFPGEVDLSGFINEQLDQRSIYLPRALPDRSMNFISIGKDWFDSMAAGTFGIPEPDLASGHTYDPAWWRETVVIVPGLAFDKEGNRLGRGGGYYDRYFSRPPMSEVTKIGVCWNLQICNEIPTQAHDVLMDWVCHERGIVRTGFGYDETFDE